ncbi:MAG: ribosomal L7Ae/L30e/S12e/Gadd45 family protein [Acholeplasmatales bacterium]|nr:ribosomal L7Ae/L30e/S12e/Gadd45 family protein [Acholeplasmatales bacterium]
MSNILNNLGLCFKAGKLIHGSDSVIEGIKSSKVKYIFLANDASENTKKRIKDKANYYSVEVSEEYTSAELSQAIGKNGRMVLGITDEGFLKILKK